MTGKQITAGQLTNHEGITVLLCQGIWTAIQHASISNSPPQESYTANPLVLGCSNEVIACVQQTIALSKVRNLSNASHL